MFCIQNRCPTSIFTADIVTILHVWRGGNGDTDPALPWTWESWEMVLVLTNGKLTRNINSLSNPGWPTFCLSETNAPWEPGLCSALIASYIVITPAIVCVKPLMHPLMHPLVLPLQRLSLCQAVNASFKASFSVTTPAIFSVSSRLQDCEQLKYGALSPSKATPDHDKQIKAIK